MEVNILDMRKLFVLPSRYEIPPFQRAYVWNHEDQWGPLWEDVQDKAEQYMETQSSQSKAHFLGAVVLQAKSVQTSMLQTRVVVDGQQRLTTLQLLLDAVQEVFEEREYIDEAQRLENLVLNSEAYRGGQPDNAFKVWPTLVDQDAFRQAMHNDLASEEYENSLIVRAHKFFKDQTRQWIAAQPQENERRAEALEKAITNLLEVVVIDLDATDDPHIIFETLNARGTALLQSDLIKNMVLYEAGKTDAASDSEAANLLWGFTDDWWRNEIRQGRLYHPRIDAFLNYWLVMRNREEVRADDGFSVFRRYCGSANRPIEEIAADISRVAGYYRSLEEDSISDMAAFRYRWKVMQMGVLTPVLLWLLSSAVPEQQLRKSLRALESHLVRRMVCGVTTRRYGPLFVGLLGRLEDGGAERAGDVIVEYLVGQEAHGWFWPDDSLLEHEIMYRPVYRLLTRSRLRIVLEGIEAELRTGMAESKAAPRGLTIEHVMPQRWQQHWPPDPEDEHYSEERRNRFVHSVGNLTLVNQPLNSALSNAPWEEKRVTLNDHTTLFLNKDLLDNAPDVWDEDAIKARARRLFQAAARVWPHADKI